MSNRFTKRQKETAEKALSPFGKERLRRIIELKFLFVFLNNDNIKNKEVR
jgi:hypothetical protein